MLEAPGGHVVGTDEMTGIQARERAASTKPMRPGRPERREHASIRHGTRSLLATRNVATGEVVAPALGPTRTAADFAAHIAQVPDPDPDAPWRFLADNRNPHHSEALVRLVATRCGLAADRIQFLYTPKHTAWLNQIALWFGILVRRVLKRGNCTSTDDPRQRILAFSASFNRTATPFTWPDKGRPLCY